MTDIGVSTITAGPDGALWFTERARNSIGRIATDGKITEFAVPTGNAFLDGITAGPDGALWFTEQAPGKIGRITTSGAITEFTLPAGALPDLDRTRAGRGPLVHRPASTGSSAGSRRPAR